MCCGFKQINHVEYMVNCRKMVILGCGPSIQLAYHRMIQNDSQCWGETVVSWIRVCNPNVNDIITLLC